jgi:hypothetical protein
MNLESYIKKAIKHTHGAQMPVPNYAKVCYRTINYKTGVISHIHRAIVAYKIIWDGKHPVQKEYEEGKVKATIKGQYQYLGNIYDYALVK